MKVRKFTLRVVQALLLVVIFTFANCGGGTAGTGGSDIRVFEGRVLDPDKQPLSAVKVTLAETGDATVTDKNGQFAFAGTTVQGPVTFVLEAEHVAASFTVNKTGLNNKRIFVNVTVDPGNNTIKIENYAAHVGIVGACDRFFENGEDNIRQANRIPQGTRCAIKVKFYSDGQRRANIPVGLESSPCGKDAHWRQVTTARTGGGEALGVTQLAFDFDNSAESCRYRVLVPYNVGGKWPLTFNIITFQQQADAP